MNDTLGNRIDFVISQTVKRKNKFAEAIGVDQTYVSHIVSGKRIPSDRIIRDICREFNLNEEWLREGKGEPFSEKQQPTDSDILQELVNNAGGNEMILAIMRCWVRLDQRQREALNDFIDQVVAEYRSFGSFMTGHTMPIIEGTDDDVLYVKQSAKKERLDLDKLMLTE